MFGDQKRALDAPYLKYLKVDRFGSMSHRTVGPFGPGLNVVFGRNEAGKTTLASFAGGVLFGWEEARGNRNTYKPQDAERAGSLLFALRDAEGAAPAACSGSAGAGAAGVAPAPAGVLVSPALTPVPAALTPTALATSPDGTSAEETLELRRVKNADGLQGDASLVADLDKETFRTMFSLTSDELRSLDNASDITSKLLTAGSGTSASPAGALERIQARLATFTSRAASAENSITRLAEERAAVRQAMNEAAAEAERFRSQAREFHDLEPKRQALNNQLDQANAALEGLTACRAGIEKIDAEVASLNAELAHLHDEERRTVADRRTRELAVGRKLARISGAEDRAMREKLDALSERESRLSHMVEVARSNFSASNAIYEALIETHDEDGARRRLRNQRIAQVVVTALMCALLETAGVPLFMQGRAAGSLSYMSLGLVMVLFGLVLAAAALVLVFKPNRRSEERAERLAGAQQTMVLDRKKLEAAEAEQAAFADEKDAALEDMGLAAAMGSLRRARVLLDEAKDARTDMALDRQRQQVASMRVSDIEARLDDFAAQRSGLIERVDLSGSVTLADLDREIASRTSQRARISEESDAANRRWGELSAELSAARGLHDFDLLKTQHQELKTRMDEARWDFARLLLAKRMLETAIEAWESESQPEVYAQASRLLSLMTDGQWTRVAISGDGVLRVHDDARNVRDPSILSVSTCQQLYLSLRIALLMCAENVGRAIPVIADDVLVNFDAERRRGAARALAELSTKRQVILLTCHEEIVSVLQEAHGDATVMEL